MQFGGLEVSGLLDTGATRTFLSHDLMQKISGHVIHQDAAEVLQIRLPNGN